MPDTANERVVLASFDGQAQAEQAAKDLMGWDKANDDVKLGAVGVLTKDEKGEIKTKNYSQQNAGKGAKVGMGLGVIAAVLSGGLTLVPSAIGGAIAGGAAGAMLRKGLGMSEEELQAFSSDLDNGRAAVLVMCDAEELQETSHFLTTAGGKTQSYTIEATDLEKAATAAEGDEQMVNTVDAITTASIPRN
jgi:hypothetical protein